MLLKTIKSKSKLSEVFFLGFNAMNNSYKMNSDYQSIWKGRQPLSEILERTFSGVSQIVCPGLDMFFSYILK